MSRQYLVSSPSVFMYLDTKENSEPTDELLFGTVVTKLDDGKNDRIFCKTNYGYSGYVPLSHLSPKQQALTDVYTVISRSGFLYDTPDYRRLPRLILPRGSRLYGVSDKETFGFLRFTLDKKQYFISKKQVTSTVKAHAFVSEEHKRAQIVKTALSYLGTPYMWAGKSPSGIDCSGLCFMSYFLCGLGIFRDAEFDGKYLRKIPKSKLKKGDLIYYNGHVALYLGGSYYIHSCATLGKVCINSFDRESPLFFPKLEGKEVCFASSLAFEG